MNTWMEAARFNWDVQRVMAARLMRLASVVPSLQLKLSKWYQKRPSPFMRHTPRC
jgi:hypothetical protein